MTDIAATAARLAAIEHTIADLTDEARTLRQMLVDAVEVGGTIQNTDGTPLYRVAPGRRTFKPAVADTILSDTLRQACTKAGHRRRRRQETESGAVGAVLHPGRTVPHRAAS